MLDLGRLRVSLTKNGYLKIADLVRRHPRWEVMDNIQGVHRGINLIRSQVANIMGEDATGELPEFWDEIRNEPDQTVDAFTLVAIIFSHVDLIHLLQSSSQGEMKGHLTRGSVGEKAYTNVVFAMASCGLCDYERGAEGVNYDMRGLVYHLREVGHLVRQLLEFKLRRCGWRPPERAGTDFFEECEANEIHRVFGLEPREFHRWLNNRLNVAPPADRGQELPRRPR